MLQVRHILRELKYCENELQRQMTDFWSLGDSGKHLHRRMADFLSLRESGIDLQSLYNQVIEALEDSEEITGLGMLNVFLWDRPELFTELVSTHQTHALPVTQSVVLSGFINPDNPELSILALYQAIVHSPLVARKCRELSFLAELYNRHNQLYSRIKQAIAGRITPKSVEFLRSHNAPSPSVYFDMVMSMPVERLVKYRLIFDHLLDVYTQMGRKLDTSIADAGETEENCWILLQIKIYKKLLTSFAINPGVRVDAEALHARAAALAPLETRHHRQQCLLRLCSELLAGAKSKWEQLSILEKDELQRLAELLDIKFAEDRFDITEIRARVAEQRRTEQAALQVARQDYLTWLKLLDGESKKSDGQIDIREILQKIEDLHQKIVAGTAQYVRVIALLNEIAEVDAANVARLLQTFEALGRDYTALKEEDPTKQNSGLEEAKKLLVADEPAKAVDILRQLIIIKKISIEEWLLRTRNNLEAALDHELFKNPGFESSVAFWKTCNEWKKNKIAILHLHEIRESLSLFLTVSNATMSELSGRITTTHAEAVMIFERQLHQGVLVKKAEAPRSAAKGFRAFFTPVEKESSEKEKLEQKVGTESQEKSPKRIVESEATAAEAPASASQPNNPAVYNLRARAPQHHKEEDRDLTSERDDPVNTTFGRTFH